jgi:SAM-dependent methyltransferase
LNNGPLNDPSCLACGSSGITRFLHLPDVPVFCNVLLPSAEEALAAPRGDLDLGICRDCGHVFNVGFDPELVRYAEGYENSLHHSPRFQSYAEELAAELRGRHGLKDAHVVEIACGQGDFLKLVCSDPGCTGTGFDPSFRGEIDAEGITIEPAYFGVRPLGRAVDLICCRHALEHIDEPVAFLESVRKALPDGSRTSVFFEVPNSLYSLRDGGVWDFIYEHVSYFCGRSMSACFEKAGYSVRRTWETFAGQFLCLEADLEDSASPAPEMTPVPATDELVGLAAGLGDQMTVLLDKWRGRVAEIAAEGGRVAVWGVGSKGVTFLNLMGEAGAAGVPVDINPQKHGRHVPGTGQQVVAPENLADLGIRLVLVMNPVYTGEIEGMVRAQGIDAEVAGV